MEEILLFFALKYQGDFQSILKALQAKEKVSQEERREAVAKVNSKYTTIISSDYPDALKEISCPPFVLFYHGNLNILNGKCIGVIGKRVPSEYGSNITDKIVPNKDSVDKIKADLVCSTLDWQMVCSKNAMAVLNIPRYKAPIIPVGVALMCTCFVKICS